MAGARLHSFRKNSNSNWLWEGHGFSRAAPSRTNAGFSPCGPVVPPDSGPDFPCQQRPRLHLNFVFHCSGAFMKFSAARRLVILLAGILALGVACSKAPDDSQLNSQIQSKLSEDSGLHGKPITVQTSGGVVTLSGTVENETQREAAARYASATPGIRQVVNNLRTDLQTTSGPAAPAADLTIQASQPAPGKSAAKLRPS